MDIEESELDVPGVIDDVGRILAGAAHGKGIELLVDVQPDVPAALLGDATRIRQVLLNFGANAVKFTSAGRGGHPGQGPAPELRAGGPPLRRRRHRRRDRRGGPGEAVQRLRPGGLLDHTTVRRHRSRPDHQPAAGGAHGGQARSRRAHRARGRPSGSSCRSDAPTMRPHSTRAEDPRTLSGQRALVVDDNATNRRILRQQLLSWGVEAVEAVDGFQALELALTAAEERTSVRPRRRRPEHARHGRHRAGAGPEGRTLHGGDDALLAELVRPPPRIGGVPPDGFRRQPDEAGAVVGAVRLPDHQPQLGIGVRVPGEAGACVRRERGRHGDDPARRGQQGEPAGGFQGPREPGLRLHHRQQRRGSRERLPVGSLRRRPHGLPDARDGRLRGHGRHSSVGGLRAATCRSSP